MRPINIMIFLCTTILSGCATLGMRQNECEQKYSSFESIVNCTKRLVSSDSRANNSLVKLYFLKGDKLAEDVKQGKISETDAKLEWQSTYVELQSLEKRNKPKFTNCYAYGNNANCITY